MRPLRRHLAWYVPPRRVDAWLAYRILCAGLVPVNDLGTQAYVFSCRVGGMVSRISRPTLLTRLRERRRKSDLSVIRIPRHFDQSRGSIICAKDGPIQIDLRFTAVFCLGTVNHLM